MSKTHSTIASFGYAISGVKLALKSEPNLRIHFLATIVVIILGIVFQITVAEIALVVLTISFVITVELINTAVEGFVNLVSPEIQPQAKLIKDVCAAGVLVSALGAFGVGLIVFGPRLLGLL